MARRRRWAMLRRRVATPHLPPPTCALPDLWLAAYMAGYFDQKKPTA